MLIDTHTHLETFARQGALDATLERARAAGVEAMITIGTSNDDWALYRDIAAARAGFVHYTVGLHPCAVDGGWAAQVAEMEAFWGSGTGLLTREAGGAGADTDTGRETRATADGEAKNTGRETRATRAGLAGMMPVGLGECGLDRFHLPKETGEAETIFAWQRAAFAAQLVLAKRLACPVVIHSRGAFAECVEMIDASGVDWARVVFHCFVEGEAEMREVMRRGGRGSFTGILTYKSAENIRAAAKAQGLARFMVETDAPYLTPAPHRGKPNEPAYVRHTAEFAAGVLGVSFETLAAVSTANARAFFGL